MTRCDCGACEARELRELLTEALYHLHRHAADYHHVTPKELTERLDAALTKGTPCLTTPSTPQP